MRGSRFVGTVICGPMVVGLLLFTGSCRSGNSSHTSKVRLGYLPISAGVSLFAAIEQGCFTRQGIVVEPVRFSNANEAMNAVISGRTDGAVMIGYSTLLSIFSNDSTAFRIIQSGAETESVFTARILVPVSSPVASVPDLAGKTIGTYSGLTQRLNLLLILSHFFPQPENSVKIIQVESNLQVQSLAAGRFDALFTIDPEATVAMRKGVARSICDSPRARFIVNPFPTCATVLATRFIKSRPVECRKVIDALNDGVSWAMQYPTEAARMMSQKSYIPVPADIAEYCGTYSWWTTGQEDTQAVQRLADVMQRNGILESSPRVQAMFFARQDSTGEK